MGLPLTLEKNRGYYARRKMRDEKMELRWWCQVEWVTPIEKANSSGLKA
jgi:hypothetical protein